MEGEKDYVDLEKEGYETDEEKEKREDNESLDELRQKTREKVGEEKEKLEQYGKIGQKVRIKDRSIVGPNEEVIGEIIGIDTKVPFTDEILDKWIEKTKDEKFLDDKNFRDGLPFLSIKVYITEGKKKGIIVDHLISSEWDPVE